MNVNDVQRHVLLVITEWARREKSPISQRKIVEVVSKERQIPCSTVKAAVRVLVTKGYIRKAVAYSMPVSYVQLRSL